MPRKLQFDSAANHAVNLRGNVTFPLTPALSLGERASGINSLDQSERLDLLDGLETILPLPRGEGRGEGEWRIRSSTVRVSEPKFMRHERETSSMMGARTDGLLKFCKAERLFAFLLICCTCAAGVVRAQQPDAQPASRDSTTNRVTASSTNKSTNDPIALIRDEGLNRSHVMETLSYLTDVIGPRLTGSPNLKRANEWTRDKLSSWGLTNAHLEAWGPFGHGWSLRRFSAQIIEPQAIPLIGYPRAWSPGFDQPLLSEIIYLDAKTDADLEKYKGKLKGAIVLTSAPRDLKARFDPLASRLHETNLLRLANAGEPQTGSPRSPRTNASPAANIVQNDSAPPRRRGSGRSSATNAVPATNVTQSGSASNPPPAAAPRFAQAVRNVSFCAQEGAALLVSSSFQGDGGTFFVQSATVPGPYTPGTNAPPPASRPSPYATNAPKIPAQITLAAEDYNRLVRMIQQGEKLKMAVDLQVQFHADELMAYNTIAEISGSDLKDELVMLGGHMDSWHSGTGATDNGAGVAVAMEAVRILKALKLQPRRTIRIGLWSGEEQGLLGSKAYVAKHFGSYTTNQTNNATLRSPRDERGGEARPRRRSGDNSANRKLVKQHEYEKFSAYFNLDNGTGKIRGVYLQGNEAVRPLFRKWLTPFNDLGAETLSLSNTGGTDHQSFDGIGLPGFQFIQDPMEYDTRTHHSNMDVFDRIQADDMKQAAVLMAAFVYNAAMMDEKLPRKPAN